MVGGDLKRHGGSSKKDWKGGGGAPNRDGDAFVPALGRIDMRRIVLCAAAAAAFLAAPTESRADGRDMAIGAVAGALVAGAIASGSAPVYAAPGYPYPGAVYPAQPGVVYANPPAVYPNPPTVVYPAPPAAYPYTGPTVIYETPTVMAPPAYYEPYYAPYYGYYRHRR